MPPIRVNQFSERAARDLVREDLIRQMKALRPTDEKIRINIKEGSYGKTHLLLIDRDEPLRDFVRAVAAKQTARGYFPPKGSLWKWDIQYRRVSVISTLLQYKTAGLEESRGYVKYMFDGGETVYFKVYDDEENERVWNKYAWEYHDRELESRRYPMAIEIVAASQGWKRGLEKLEKMGVPVNDEQIEADQQNSDETSHQGSEASDSD